MTNKELRRILSNPDPAITKAAHETVRRAHQNAERIIAGMNRRELLDEHARVRAQVRLDLQHLGQRGPSLWRRLQAVFGWRREG